ncbi:MAG: polysaccharide deacetylase family protein [Sphingobium sp.]|jgi:predicted deacetylase|uniref:polysaccharide deacetylase family protein n=1 Tax=Sphingobium sp. JS3065 TaxID=2970925 RepID=UPI0022648448|nr:polysaccharide deacetylase family protein [Sphingobium sp. JS3065]MCI1270687.1 polysaccharide deacetylase family protein [Sphingobium sp.]MCI1754416.1 polysaccharide deacetylase family protein [Sphingobium sp.]MCI2053354.1 polysaccharide deacetylase family protein [Sphingobium sp.]UZW56740.1 polysaccharide deacetylase family protein [Sphingobium sp. JS3065]
MPNSKRLLLASIHDVGPRFEHEVDRLADRMAGLLGGPRFAMLVVPDHWDEAPLSKAKGYQRKLRAWSDAGVEMFLHGWRHRDDSVHVHGVARFRARHMTAGEGEFLGLEREEALRRMRAGRAIVENAIGRPVAGFIAPAWLYGEGARAALLDEDFALTEDHMRVWCPSDGRVLARGPVITWASRSTSRIASSLAFASLARAALDIMPTVRIAVHPGDTKVPSLLNSIDKTVTRFVRDRTVGRYGDLLD